MKCGLLLLSLAVLAPSGISLKIKAQQFIEKSFENYDADEIERSLTKPDSPTIARPYSVQGLRIRDVQNSSSESETCWVTAKSNGGLGHILKSMITTMGLHGMPLPITDQNPSTTEGILQYDATTPREYHFDGHYEGKEREDAEAFFEKVNQNFKKRQCKEHSCSPDGHRMVFIGDGIQSMTGNCESDVTYQVNTLNSARHYDRTSLLANIHKRTGVITELLPKHDLPKNGKTVVMHVRLGDSGRRGKRPAERVTEPLNFVKEGPSLDAEQEFELELQNSFDNVLSEIEKNKGYDHLIVHTDDERRVHHFLKGRKPDQIFGVRTPMLFVLSQMAHADTLIASDSSLSISAAYLRDGLGHKEDNTFIPKRSEASLLPPHKWY